MACAMCSAAKGKKSWSPVITSAGMFRPLSLELGMQVVAVGRDPSLSSR